MNEYNTTSKNIVIIIRIFDYYKDNEEKNIFHMLKSSNCLSYKNKKIIFRRRYHNSCINIMKIII